ncbi:hypothetical protein ACQJBY_014561 [Aegilops geniculata]
MAPVMTGEEVGGGTTMEKQSLADVQFIWNEWEVHFMILASLFLQVFLFLFAGFRRRCKCWLLQTVLWLAYLSADSVAIFVLGHLAVRAGKSGHHLMYFWAPFVLVHLGGQDTITALSKQDNELWTRHLLILVTQGAMVGYVVSKASWPDSRLKAAVVIMFLSGCFKYAERTFCLFLASPVSLKLLTVGRRFLFFNRIGQQEPWDTVAEMRETLDTMLKGSPIFWSALKVDNGYIPRIPYVGVFDDIFSVDPPINRKPSLESADILPDMLKDFLSNANRHKAYEYVGAWRVHCYRCLYTKFPLRLIVINFCGDYIRMLKHTIENLLFCHAIWLLIFTPFLLVFALFHIVSTPIALVLFWASEKGDRLHTASRADITVSYILLLGALILDVSSAILFLVEYLSIILGEGGRCTSTILHVANWIKLNQKINQYNMIQSRAVPPLMSRTMLCAMIAAFCEKPKSIDIPKDDDSIQNFILDSLLRSGARGKWNIASSHGKLAIEKWIEDSHQDPDSTRIIGNALEDSINFDFPTSVLIWHIATDMCYYDGDKTSTDPEKSKKQISRELSNYIMYLIFKCGVALTANIQVVLEKTHDKVRTRCIFPRRRQKKITDEDAVRNIIEAMEKEDSAVVGIRKVEETVNEKEDSAVVEIRKVEETVNEPEDSTVIEILMVEEQANQKEEQVNDNNAAALPQILPRAYKVARELISINDESERWELIASVWTEMLFYIAPRCRASFHYEHLSTGGEFVTDVLLLMYFLGPFLPRTGAGAS